MPTPEVAITRLTTIMKKYEYLKLRLKLYFLMIFIISVTAIILGSGIINNNEIKYLDKNKRSDSLTIESILASISGLLSSGALLFSILLTTIKDILSKDEDDVFFVVKKFQKADRFYNDVFFDDDPFFDENYQNYRNKNLFYVEDNDDGVKEFDMKKIEKRNRKLQLMRVVYRMITMIGAFLLIIFTILILNSIVNERNSIKDVSPENCQKFTDCLDFMKSQNLSMGEFDIVCNVTTAEVTNNSTIYLLANYYNNTVSPYDKSIICQKDIFGCNEPRNMDLHANYYNNTASSYVKYYFDNCYGLVPRCCCREVDDDCERIQCCCINIRVSRIVFTNDEEDYLYNLKRKNDIEIKIENGP
ncbi:hypothetical protein C1645_826268 [Glomus cerebriforme]|uniref:Uncharacterized protein n=1 Tax=Glomus cerebriforme TaxID=658196 RepID=A0A397SR53_9GLOM|nr:hypothetical protein C1645_826268 [Glomus cerebriforme]